MVQTGKATVGQDLMRLLEKLADDKPVVSTRRNDETGITIMRRKEVLSDENSLKTEEQRGGTNISREYSGRHTQVNNATEQKTSFEEDVEDLGLDQGSREWTREGR